MENVLCLCLMLAMACRVYLARHNKYMLLVYIKSFNINCAHSDKLLNKDHRPQWTGLHGSQTSRYEEYLYNTGFFSIRLARETR